LPGCVHKTGQQVLSADNVMISYHLQAQGKQDKDSKVVLAINKNFWIYS